MVSYMRRSSPTIKLFVLTGTHCSAIIYIQRFTTFEFYFSEEGRRERAGTLLCWKMRKAIERHYEWKTEGEEYSFFSSSENQGKRRSRGIL